MICLKYKYILCIYIIMNNNTGQLSICCGCMFSGKTSALINVAKMNKMLERVVLIINFNEDSRYSESNKITTHDGVSLDCVPCDKNILSLKSTKEYQESEVICINEGQFFENLVIRT